MKPRPTPSPGAQLRTERRTLLLREGLGPASDDWVAAEEPLQLRVDGEELAVLMRTPGHDEELGVGFLRTEGWLRNLSELATARLCEAAPSTLDIRLQPGHALPPEAWERRVFAASSCGVCGKASVAAILQRCEVFQPRPRFDPGWLLDLPETLAAAQQLFSRTGGVHAAGIVCPDGGLLCLREDVGRHNATDKAIGHCFLRGRPLCETALVLSGRVSFELVQKAAMAGIPAICAIGAPSDLAIALARDLRMLLVAFARAGRGNLYCGQAWLTGEAPPAGGESPGRPIRQ